MDNPLPTAPQQQIPPAPNLNPNPAPQPNPNLNAPPKPNPAAIPSQPPKRNSSNTWIIIIIIFFLLAAVTVVFLLLPKGTPQTPSGPVIPTPANNQLTPTIPGEVTWTSYDGTDYIYQYPSNWTNGEGGKAFYNLQSPDFVMTPFKGAIIIVDVAFVKDPNDTMENTIKKLDTDKVSYENTTISEAPAIRYDEVVSAGNDEVGHQQDYKTITLFYKNDKKIRLMYAYEKDHKDDNLQTYLRFLASFRLKQ